MNVQHEIDEDVLTRANVAGVLEHELAKRKALIRVLKRECKELDAALASLKALESERPREQISEPARAVASEAEPPKRRRGRTPKTASSPAVSTAPSSGSSPLEVWSTRRRRGRPRKQPAPTPPAPVASAPAPAVPVSHRRGPTNIDNTDTFVRIAKAAEGRPSPICVRCLTCGDPFPDAKALGIHRTRVHFSAESSTEVN